MATYKFLARGALGPISGFAWPVPTRAAPGTWVQVEGTLAACARGVHVCRTVHLAHWLHDELWEIETGGDRIEALDCLVVRRARLTRRIDAWSEGGATRFVNASIHHASTIAGSDADDVVRGLLTDAELAVTTGYPAVAAFTAALVVAKLAGPTEEEGAYRAERAWQAAWIERELIAG